MAVEVGASWLDAWREPVREAHRAHACAALEALGVRGAVDAWVSLAVVERAAGSARAFDVMDAQGQRLGRLFVEDDRAPEQALAAFGGALARAQTAPRDALREASPVPVCVVHRDGCSLALHPRALPRRASASGAEAEAGVARRERRLFVLATDRTTLGRCRAGDALLVRSAEHRDEEVAATAGSDEGIDAVAISPSPGATGLVMLLARGEPLGVGRTILVDGTVAIELLSPEELPQSVIV